MSFLRFLLLSSIAPLLLFLFILTFFRLVAAFFVISFIQAPPRKSGLRWGELDGATLFKRGVSNPRTTGGNKLANFFSSFLNMLNFFFFLGFILEKTLLFLKGGLYFE